MKRKTLANIIMVVLIVCIAAGGLVWVGSLKGWFDRPQEGGFVLAGQTGVVTLTRNGLAFTPETGSALREGDELHTEPSGSVTLQSKDGTIVLNRNSTVVLTDGVFDLTSGEAFVTQGAGVLTMRMDAQTLQIENAVIHLSMRQGAQSAGIFSGTLEGEAAGQRINWVGNERSVNPMELAALNSFVVAQIRSAQTTLCFTAADLDKLEAERLAKLQELIDQAKRNTTNGAAPTEPTEPDAPTQPSESVSPTDPAAPTSPTDPTGPTVPTSPTNPTNPTTPTNPTDPINPTGPTSPTNPTEPSTPAPTEPSGSLKSCVITIRCDTILNNLGDLKPGKMEFVPGDGEILAPVLVWFEEGETVFDVLKRVCEAANIQIEYSWTPLYGSYYIEGINHLYEFDCGQQSGWMYKVNEWFPNYGCSSYYLEDGDVIVWCYTCQGLGEDVGRTGQDW